jgi:cytochrome c oxidase subunit III
MGIWIFLATEILFFGGLWMAYLYGRSHWPEGFALAGLHTHVVLGTVNTALMLSSSVLVAMAVSCTRYLQRSTVALLLVASAALGALFLGLKVFEYVLEWREGLLPGPAFALASIAGAQLFFMLYFVMTSLHALHLVIGIGLLGAFAWAIHRHSRWADAPQRLEAAGLYWHFVDVVWIVLYPLLYLQGRHP